MFSKEADDIINKATDVPDSHFKQSVFPLLCKVD